MSRRQGSGHLSLYPDSIGQRLTDLVSLLQEPAFDGAFSLLYLLPTCFHSNLDRGFSVIDYDLNEALVTADDLTALSARGIQFKLAECMRNTARICTRGWRSGSFPQPAAGATLSENTCRRPR